MKTMNVQRIKYLQRTYLPTIFWGVNIQEMIDNGTIWGFEGAMGRHANDLLRWGVCMLPSHPTQDYYGHRIPTRAEVQPGSPGSFQNCREFWEGIDGGDPDALDVLSYI